MENVTFTNANEFYKSSFYTTIAKEFLLCSHYNQLQHYIQCNFKLNFIQWNIVFEEFYFKETILN